MWRLMIFLILQLAGSLLMAQQKHFVYFQSENRKDFVVKAGEMTVASSALGYALVANLPEEGCLFDFDMKQVGEESVRFFLKISDDAGYKLKYYQDSGWRLIDIRNAEMFSPMAEMTKANQSEHVADSFTSMLADVVNAPALKEVATNQDLQKSIVPDTVTLIKSVLNFNVRELVYLERINGLVDTVMLQLEYDPSAMAKGNIVIIQEENNKKTKEQEKSTGRKKKKEKLNQQEELIIPENDTANNLQLEVKRDSLKNNEKSGSLETRGCIGAAVFEDFFQLRKKMAGGANDELMLSIAEKGLKKVCYNTEQISNLCFLFLRDEGRLQFFELAYPLVSDPDHFYVLEKWLSDETTLQRFRSMIKK